MRPATACGSNILWKSSPVARPAIYDEQRPECADGDDHDGDGGFGLKPEDVPDTVEGAIIPAGWADADDGYDNHDDTETENGAEDELCAEADASTPEELERDGCDYSEGD